MGSNWLTTVSYRDEILAPHVLLFRDAVGPNFLLIDDNARSHRTQMVDVILKTEDIVLMNWPDFSTDLNPIEHGWTKVSSVPNHLQGATCLGS